MLSWSVSKSSLAFGGVGKVGKVVGFSKQIPVAQLKQRSICKELQSSQLRRRILACTGRQILAPKTARLNQTGSKSSDHIGSKNKITSGPKQITSSNMPMDNIPIYGFSNWNLQLGRFSQPCLVGHPYRSGYEAPSMASWVKTNSCRR
jgi:hypothetical protein